MANYCKDGVTYTFTTVSSGQAGCTNYPNGYWTTNTFNINDSSRQIIGYGQTGGIGTPIYQWIRTSNASQSCIIQTSTAPYNNNIPPLAEFGLTVGVCPPPPPGVGYISPTSGNISGGTSITITGTGFTGATAVTIGGVAATSFTVVSSTSITATTPAHAVGVVSVLVTTPNGTSAGNNLFTYTQPSPLCVPISATVTIRPWGTPYLDVTRSVDAFYNSSSSYGSPITLAYSELGYNSTTYPTVAVMKNQGDQYIVMHNNWTQGAAGGYAFFFGDRLITPNTTQTYYDSHPINGEFETTITWGAVYSSTPTPTPTPSPTPTSTLSPCAAPANTNTGPFFFPTTHATNDIYSFAGRAWYWNSYAWHRYCGTSTTPTPGAVAGYILNLNVTYPDNTHDYVSSGAMYPIALIEGKPLYTTANGCNSVYYNNAYGKWIFTGRYGEKDSAYQGLVVGISGPSSGDTFPTTGWVVTSHQASTTGVVTISTAPQAVPPAWVDYICLETTGMYSGQVNGAYFSTSTSNGNYSRLDGAIGNPGASCGPELVRNGTTLNLTANGYLWSGNLSYLDPVLSYGETPHTRSAVMVYLNTCGPTTTPTP